MGIRALAFATVALALAAPQFANAHTELVSSTPAANSNVRAPAKVELRFNEAVIGVTARAQIEMMSMPEMAAHEPMPVTGLTARLGRDRKSLTLLMKAPLSPGTYQVSWRAAGADTHPQSGKFSFTVK
jgi:methionine-rich copper-binding protein CopC